VPGNELKHRFLDLTQVAFSDGQEAENEFKVTRDPLKHRFLGFTHFAFWAGQEEGNVFSVPGDHLKHRFLDLTKVEFCFCEDVESSLYRLEESRILDWSRSRK